MSRIDLEKLRAARDRLGEAVLDPTLWPELITEICAAIDSKGAVVLRIKDRDPRTSPATESMREVMETYFRDGWCERDYRAVGIPLLERGHSVYTDQDITTPDLRRKHPYYNEFIKKLGVDWFAGVGFQAGEGRLWGILALQRSDEQGLFEEDETRILADLSKYLTEVATFSAFAGRQVVNGIVNSFDVFHQPAVAMSNVGAVITTNAAMDQLLGDDIHIYGKRLVVSDSKAQSALDRLWQRVSITSEHKALGGSEPIVVRRPMKQPILVRAVPVPLAVRSPFVGARVILVFENLSAPAAPSEPLLRTVFSFTPAEAKLAAALMQGVSLRDAATVLGVGYETAKTHMKAIYGKTGTHRQSELAALLARI